MKKTIKLLVILLGTIILLAGCAKLDYNVDVEKDGSADVEYIIGVSTELLQSDSTNTDSGTSLENIYLETLKSMAKEAEKQGYSYEDYKDDEYTGYKIKKHVDNVSDISLQLAFGEDVIQDNDDNKIKYSKDGMKVSFTQNATFDLSEYVDGYEFMYSVNLPVKVTESNATKTEGNKLTWELKAGQSNDVNFKAEGQSLGISGNNTKTFIIIAIVLVIAIAIVVVVIVVISKSQKNKKTITITPDNEKLDVKPTTVETISTEADKTEKVEEKPVVEEQKDIKKENTTEENK